MLCARLPGDLLSDQVRLLRGHAALLVRAGCRIANREDIVVVAHPERIVDEDEAARVAGNAHAIRPGQERKMHDTVAGKPGTRRQLDDRRTWHGRTNARERLDTGSPQRGAHPLRSRGAECAQRLALGRDHVKSMLLTGFDAPVEQVL